MTNEMSAKINFKKIALFSLILGVVVFLIKNLITYIIFRKTGIEIFSTLGLNGISLIVYSFFYYYIHTFILFSIFVYFRGSLPDEYKKAGSIFALVAFLLGDNIYSVLKFITDSSPVSLLWVAGDPATFGVAELISSIISLLIISLIMSYAFERFYKK